MKPVCSKFPAWEISYMVPICLKWQGLRTHHQHLPISFIKQTFQQPVPFFSFKKFPSDITQIKDIFIISKTLLGLRLMQVGYKKRSTKFSGTLVVFALNTKVSSQAKAYTFQAVSYLFPMCIAKLLLSVDMHYFEVITLNGCFCLFWGIKQTLFSLNNIELFITVSTTKIL